MNRLFLTALTLIATVAPQVQGVNPGCAHMNEEVDKRPTPVPGKAPPFEELPHKALTQIAAYLTREDMNAFRQANRKCAKAGFDGALLKARGTRIRVKNKEDLPFLAKSLQAPTWRAHPIVMDDTTITDEDLVHLKNATTMNLSFCKKITDEGLAHLGNATTVNLSFCEKITDKGLASLKNATTVHLSGCQQITDEGLAHLGNATTVNLSCTQITDEGLPSLKNATTVDLSFCKKITDEGLVHLENATTINLHGCKKSQTKDCCTWGTPQPWTSLAAKKSQTKDSRTLGTQQP
ncbi:MAG: hypothetical protein LCH26_06000 [Proteobacteria bacterium]|nr:hypothetical protein [Pseudomonadota bacterium]